MLIFANKHFSLMITKSIVVESHGDINSISYEIIMKTFKHLRMLEFCCRCIWFIESRFIYKKY